MLPRLAGTSCVVNSSSALEGTFARGRRLASKYIPEYHTMGYIPRMPLLFMVKIPRHVALSPVYMCYGAF